MTKEEQKEQLLKLKEDMKKQPFYDKLKDLTLDEFSKMIDESTKDVPNADPFHTLFMKIFGYYMIKNIDKLGTDDVWTR